MRNDPERSSPSPRSRGCPVAPTRLSRKPPALDRAVISPERWRSVRGCFPLKELFSKLSVREGPPCYCVVFFPRNASGGQIRAKRLPLPKEKRGAGRWAKPGDRPIHWFPLRSAHQVRFPFPARAAGGDNGICRPPSTDQKPEQKICHFDVAIFAPVKSELESRPSRSQMPSASANDTSRWRTFSGVTNAIEPDQASGAPGR